MIAAANGRSASATAISTTPAQTFGGIELLRPCTVIPRPLSRALAHTLAQKARRPEDQHEDQHEEGEHVLIVTAEEAHLAIARSALLLQRVGQKREAADVRDIADVPGAEGLDDAEQDPAEHRPREVAESAKHRGGECLEPEQ